MKTATILPFLCVLAAAAPTLNKRQSAESDDLNGLLGGLKNRQSADSDAGLGGLLGGLKKRQSSEGEDLDGLLGGMRRRQSSDSDGLGDVLDGLKSRQSSDSDDLNGLLGGLGARQNSESDGLDDMLSGMKKRQSSDSDDLNGLLGGLRARQSSSSDSDNDDNDDSLLNVLDGSGLQVDGNGQNINIADLRRRQQTHRVDLSDATSHLSGSDLDSSIDRNAQDISAVGLRKRQLRGPASSSSTNNGDGNGDNDDTLLNAVDGSRAGINQNAQNISVAELRRKRQLLGALGGEESETNSGNGDNDESLLNLLDGSTAQVDRNIQNVTVLRRYQSQHQTRHESSVSLATKVKRWLSAVFARDTPVYSTDTSNSDNGDDDETLANVLNGSEAAVDDNAQDINVLRRRQVSSPSSAPTPSASAVPSSSAAPIAPAQQDPAAAAPAPRPALNAADGDNTNDNDGNRDDDDALVNAADDSGADVSKNLQNVTVLKHRRGTINNDNTNDGNGDDDETLANVLDGSALQADDNADGVDVADL